MTKKEIKQRLASYKKQIKRQGDFTIYASSWVEAVEYLLAEELNQKPSKEEKKNERGTVGGGSGARSSEKKGGERVKP